MTDPLGDPDALAKLLHRATAIANRAAIEYDPDAALCSLALSQAAHAVMRAVELGLVPAPGH